MTKKPRMKHIQRINILLSLPVLWAETLHTGSPTVAHTRCWSPPWTCIWNVYEIEDDIESRRCIIEKMALLLTWGRVSRGRMVRRWRGRRRRRGRARRWPAPPCGQTGQTACPRRQSSPSFLPIRNHRYVHCNFPRDIASQINSQGRIL